MRRRTIGLFGAALAAAGCHHAPECSRRPRDWPFAQSFTTASHRAETHVVQTGSGGTIWSDGHRMTLAELEAEIEAASHRLPPPHVVLRQRPGGDCATIEAVRDLFDRSPLCATGHCAEAKVWERRTLKQGP